MMKNNKLNIILIIINILAFYYLKKEIGTTKGLFDLYLLVPLIFLGIFLSKVKYLIWSVIFIGSIGLILHGEYILSLPQNKSCSAIMCDFNGAIIIAPIIVAITTGILLLIQLIQYIIKRNKKKNPAGEIRYPYEVK